ncbi:hypothetical protein LTR37_014250 [Vermiconidia calcicola]|uniref:Uncharacterized protein n=1 Tax=Vermiconidia calcicola TaxID=1690605 RepID=A0ACC3MU33_9PEZI|nr:hypothetical protein LTR37_014250 [Vermiconidia calcicola]
MPRDGSGASDNAIENSHNIVHGNSAGENDAPAGSGVDRSNKAAPPPDLSTEKGEALEGHGASGGGDSATGSGKGPLDMKVDPAAK